MIILIGGDSHTGKTLLARKLLERYRFPCTSLDHLKMGLIRGLPSCPFTAEDEDSFISLHIWEIIRGIIETCLENRQDLILEGVYLPPDKVSGIRCPEILPLYLGFSDAYLRAHWDYLTRFEDVVEHRMGGDGRSLLDVIEANLRTKQLCSTYDLPFFEIREDYTAEMQAVIEYTDGLVTPSPAFF